MKELTIKKRMKDMKTIVKIMVISMLWLCAPAEAQVLVDEVQPAATFQSTSTMTGSGSVYSSNPVLNEEGSAVYGGGASYSPAHAQGRPRKAPDPISSDDDLDEDTGTGLDTPVGDALLPLLLMALAFGAWRFRRVRD